MTVDKVDPDRELANLSENRAWANSTLAATAIPSKSLIGRAEISNPSKSSNAVRWISKAGIDSAGARTSVDSTWWLAPSRAITLFIRMANSMR